MFNTTKYTKWYFRIIDIAKNRLTNGYTENHHILPKSIGGNNTNDNLVKLTAREHFICHWLLTKMTSGNNKAKMIYALNGMKRNSKGQARYESAITSKVYARIKPIVAKQSSDSQKGRACYPVTEESRLKISLANSGEKNGMFGKKHTAENLAKQIAAQTGMKRTPEQRERMRQAQLNRLELIKRNALCKDSI
jgi:hypothetical protein